MKIRVSSEKSNFKIYINEILHLNILKTELIGIQSWTSGNGVMEYWIEYSLRTTTILCEYDDRIKWKTILKLIDDKNIFKLVE